MRIRTFASALILALVCLFVTASSINAAVYDKSSIQIGDDPTTLRTLSTSEAAVLVDLPRLTLKVFHGKMFISARFPAYQPLPRITFLGSVAEVHVGQIIGGVRGPLLRGPDVNMLSVSIPENIANVPWIKFPEGDTAVVEEKLFAYDTRPGIYRVPFVFPVDYDGWKTSIWMTFEKVVVNGVDFEVYPCITNDAWGNQVVYIEFMFWNYGDFLPGSVVRYASTDGSFNNDEHDWAVYPRPWDPDFPNGFVAVQDLEEYGDVARSLVVKFSAGGHSVKKRIKLPAPDKLHGCKD